MIHILIADPDPGMRSLLTTAVESSLPKALVRGVSTEEEACKLFQKYRFEAVLAEDFPNGELHKLTRQKAPYLLCSGHSHERCHTNKEDVEGFLQKPFEYADLELCLTTLNARLKKDSGRAEAKYRPVDPYLLNYLENVPCSVFLETFPNNLIKVVAKGAGLYSEEVRKFLDSGVKRFYIKSVDLPLFIETTLQAMEPLVKARSLQSDVVTKILEANYRIVRDSIAQMGFSENLVKLSTQSAELALQTIGTHDSLSSLLMRLEIKEKDYLATHSSQLAYIAGVIGTALDPDCEWVRYQMALAGFLHDMVLTDALAENRLQLEFAVQGGRLDDEKEVIRYRNHPAEAANLIQTQTELPESLAIIIQNHHVRPDKRGFPKDVDIARLDPLSAAFILSHEFLDCWAAEERFLLPTFIAELMSKYPYTSFQKPLAAVTAAFQR